MVNGTRQQGDDEYHFVLINDFGIGLSDDELYTALKHVAERRQAAAAHPMEGKSTAVQDCADGSG